MRLLYLIVLWAVVANAKVNVTTVAAVSTIGVNLLEAKTRIQQARTAARATKKAARAVGRRLVGK